MTVPTTVDEFTPNQLFRVACKAGKLTANLGVVLRSRVSYRRAGLSGRPGLAEPMQNPGCVAALEWLITSE